MQRFPQQYCLTQPPYNHPYPTMQPNDNQIIQQLRRENQMLKQQLQAVLRMQTRSPSPSLSPSPALTPRANHFMPLPHAQNQEDQAETAYRNKMSKLKNKKSNHKSYDNSATAPVSPHGSFLGQERPHSRQQYQVPKLLMAEPKMMVISKDKEAKFFRDRSKEQHLATVRKANISQEKRSIQHVFQANKENTFAKVPRGHQRVESALPIEKLDRTQRIYQQITPVPSMVNIPQRPNLVRSPQNHLKSEPNQAHRQAYPFPSNNAHIYQLPRGHVYVGAEQNGRSVNRKESTADFTSQGDSRLSIELDLRNARSARRLRYDIYMQEDRA